MTRSPSEVRNKLKNLRTLYLSSRDDLQQRLPYFHLLSAVFANLVVQKDTTKEDRDSSVHPLDEMPISDTDMEDGHHSQSHLDEIIQAAKDQLIQYYRCSAATSQKTFLRAIAWLSCSYEKQRCIVSALSDVRVLVKDKNMEQEEFSKELAAILDCYMAEYLA